MWIKKEFLVTLRRISIQTRITRPTAALHTMSWSGLIHGYLILISTSCGLFSRVRLPFTNLSIVHLMGKWFLFLDHFNFNTPTSLMWYLSIKMREEIVNRKDIQFLIYCEFERCWVLCGHHISVNLKKTDNNFLARLECGRERGKLSHIFGDVNALSMLDQIENFLVSHFIAAVLLTIPNSFRNGSWARSRISYFTRNDPTPQF